MTAIDQDGWREGIVYQSVVGPFRMVRTRGGDVRLSIDDDDRFVWTWPTFSPRSDRMDFAEQLANALAVADGRFEVRSIRT